jgi:ABC-type molybdenum transport system ATPase subunit/photorepair protein PhrA
MVIDGYEGTGKSTLIKHIKDEYPEMCNIASLINPSKPKESLRITATTNKITAKSLDSPATPPNPNRLAMSAITAKIIAQRNIMLSSLFFIVI